MSAFRGDQQQQAAELIDRLEDASADLKAIKRGCVDLPARRSGLQVLEKLVCRLERELEQRRGDRDRFWCLQCGALRTSGQGADGYCRACSPTPIPKEYRRRGISSRQGCRFCD